MFAAGFAVVGKPSFGANSSRSSGAPCGPGAASITGITMTESGAAHGGTITATFTVPTGCDGTTVSLATYSMTGEPGSEYPQTLFDSVSQTLNAGTYTFTASFPKCFWQVDLVTGAPLPTIDANNLYLTRKARAFTGGSFACTTTTTTETTTTGTTTTGTTETTTTGTTTTGTTETTTTGTTTTGTTETTTTGTTTTGTTTTTTTPTTTAHTTTTGTTTTAPFVPPAITDVAVTKVADHSSVSVGQQVIYTITVVNNGPDTADNVLLADPLPAQESLVSVSDTTDCSGTTVVTCNFGSLAPGASKVVVVTTLAQSTGTAGNTATVSTTSPESSTANNQATASVTISGAFRPAGGTAAVCSRLSLAHATNVVAAKRTTLVVHVLHNGKPTAGARVEFRGPGILVVRKTNAHGVLRLAVTPHKIGVVRVRLLQASSCQRQLAEVAVRGAFTPPKLTG
ncbi:MAG: DUF11 domain-containing protein [Gaiellaceae bacterium]